MSEFSMFRSDCAVLKLVLTRRWYEKIRVGEKREEYRLATDFWHKRLDKWDRNPAGTPVVEFRLGYAKDAPRMAFWVFGQNTVSGMKTYALVDDYTDKPRHPEWGEPDGAHFVIKLGGRIRLRASKPLATNPVNPVNPVPTTANQPNQEKNQ